jgi:hypothetical protein
VPNHHEGPNTSRSAPPQGLPTWVLVLALLAFEMWTVIWFIWNALLAGMGDDGCPQPQGYGPPIDEEWQWFPPGMRCSYNVSGISNLVEVPPSMTGTVAVIVLGVVAAGVLVLDRRKGNS